MNTKPDQGVERVDVSTPGRHFSCHRTPRIWPIPSQQQQQPNPRVRAWAGVGVETSTFPPFHRNKPCASTYRTEAPRNTQPTSKEDTK